MADQSTTSSENLIKKMSRWLLASATLILVLQLNQVEANAAAGISEVWSETDGMRMKYSTNHGDLLSSKGSEMSLSSDQKHHVEPAAGGGGGGESSTGDESAAAAAEGGGGGGESQGEESGEQKGEAGEGGSEQADSRKTEKVVPAANPTAGRVHFYSSLAGQTGPAQSSGRSHQHQFRSSASSRSTSEAPSSSYDFSGSAPEDQMVNDNGEVTATGGEQSSADAAAADEPLANEAPAGKFRAPGKHFKEAVKMVSSHKSQETKADTGADSDSESGRESDSKDEGEEKSSAEETPSRPKSGADDPSDESAEFNAAGDGSWGAALERQAASGKRAQAQEENDYGRPFEGPAAGLDTDSPISMAGSPLDRPEQMMYNQATARNQMMGVSHFGSGGEDDEQMPLSNFRAASPSAGPMFYEGSAQSSRALLAAGGNSHRERSQPSNAATAAAASKRSQSQQTTGGQAANKQQAYKQLSYFKSVPDHPQRAGAAPVPRYPGAARGSSSNAAAAAAAAAPDSPDSVRDNFISPGHYPGSMPHLTQAASEIAQSKSTAANSKETPNSSPSEVAPSGVAVPSPSAAATTTTAVANEEANTKSSSSQQVTTGDSSTQSALVSSSDINNQLRGATTTAEQQQGQAAAESKEVVSVITVTPSPESQPESQQIMAPILVTTTTMAPLLPTAAPSSTTPASTGTGITTSQTPALKRFKFRKYR